MRTFFTPTLAVASLLLAGCATPNDPNGGKVFLYERKLLASAFVPSTFERAAQECL
jgi:hypothetical protein